jgi:hypothetical protein
MLSTDEIYMSSHALYALLRMTQLAGFAFWAQILQYGPNLPGSIRGDAGVVYTVTRVQAQSSDFKLLRKRVRDALTNR